MTYKIHFEHLDGTPDFFVVSGVSIEDIRGQAAKELAIRNGRNPWSEEIARNGNVERTSPERIEP